MDYVRGVPVQQYVHDKKLSLEEALQLFAKVCDAVNYAHQKGVIHRDLKPSNILVNGKGEPQVLDFGLAKMVGGPEQTLISMTGQVLGTLPYMSPEQALGNTDEIDTRTDVYALGVILYEMLTGQYPYPVAGQMADVLKHIAETPPTPPSRQWKSDSGVTERSKQRLRPGECPIDDEVQTIVLRTLAKERERRYQSAGELAKDVGHYLVGEPIEAKRDSAGYILRKRLRRYRLAIVVAAAFAVVLAAGLATSLVFLRKLQRAAEEEMAAMTFLHEVITSICESAEHGHEPTVRDMLEEADKRIEAGALSELPDVEAHTGMTIARTYEAMGLPAEAEQHWRSVLAMFRQIRGKDQDVAYALSRLGYLLRDKGDYVAAERSYREALEGRRRVLGDDHRDTLLSISDMGILLSSMGKHEEALPYFREALGVSRRVVGDDHPDTLTSISNIGTLLSEMGKHEEALPYCREALEGFRRVLGDDHPDTLTSISNMGTLLSEMGKHEEALPYYREALEGERRALGDDNPDTLTSISRMGVLLHSMGKQEEALGHYREALEGRRRVLGDDDPDTLGSINNMGGLLHSMGKYEEALPYCREALEGFRRVLGDDHPDTLNSIGNMGVLLGEMGKHEEALPYCREALEGFRRVLGDDHPDTLDWIGNMGGLLSSMDKQEEALPYVREALDGRSRVLGDGHPDTLRSINGMGNLLRAMGEYEEALPYCREALEGRRRALGDDHPSTLDSINGMGNLLRRDGRIRRGSAVLPRSAGGPPPRPGRRPPGHAGLDQRHGRLTARARTTGGGRSTRCRSGSRRNCESSSYARGPLCCAA